MEAGDIEALREAIERADAAKAATLTLTLALALTLTLTLTRRRRPRRRACRRRRVRSCRSSTPLTPALTKPYP